MTIRSTELSPLNSALPDVGSGDYQQQTTDRLQTTQIEYVTTDALAAVRGVSTVHDLHVWSIGSDRAALSAHLELERMEEWPAILHASQSLLRERFGIDHVTLQPELAPALREAPVTLWPRGQRPL